jgi:hypothetical protein
MLPIPDAPGGPAGDADAAIRQLYARHAPALRKYVERFGPDRAGADDMDRRGARLAARPGIGSIAMRTYQPGPRGQAPQVTWWQWLLPLPRRAPAAVADAITAFVAAVDSASSLR